MRNIHFLGTYFVSFNVQVMNEDELHVFLAEKNPNSLRLLGFKQINNLFFWQIIQNPF